MELFEARREIETILRNQNVYLAGGGELRRVPRDEMVVCCNGHHRAMNPAGRVVTRGIGYPLPRCFGIAEIGFSLDAPAQYLKADALFGIPVLPYVVEYFKRTNPWGPEWEWTNTLYHKLNTRPLTGIIALEFLRRMPVSRVFVTGMTFYRDPATGEIPFKHGGHKMIPQIDYCAELQHTDRRFVFDDTITEILAQHRAAILDNLEKHTPETEQTKDSERAAEMHSTPPDTEAQEALKACAARCPFRFCPAFRKGGLPGECASLHCGGRGRGDA